MATKSHVKKTSLFLGITFALVCIGSNVKASGGDSLNYATNPCWINMMHDTNTNYYTALKAFDTYWRGREKPEEENDLFTREDGDKKVQKAIPYAFEYKMFKLWELHVQPYVQDNGFILYPYQRLQLNQSSRNRSSANIIK